MGGTIVAACSAVFGIGVEVDAFVAAFVRILVAACADRGDDVPTGRGGADLGLCVAAAGQHAAVFAVFVAGTGSVAAGPAVATFVPAAAAVVGVCTQVDAVAVAVGVSGGAGAGAGRAGLT